MGHALQESWRVLVPEGYMIDLRPLASSSPVEVMIETQICLAGRIDDSRDQLDDLAAASTLAQLVNEGWFVCEQTQQFPYIVYWDNPEEMSQYIEQKRSSLVLPPVVLAEACRLLANSPGAKLRIPFIMEIARYRKLRAITTPISRAKFTG